MKVSTITPDIINSSFNSTEAAGFDNNHTNLTLYTDDSLNQDSNLMHQLNVLNTLTNKKNTLSDVLKYQNSSDERIKKLAKLLICSFRNQIKEKTMEP